MPRQRLKNSVGNKSVNRQSVAKPIKRNSIKFVRSFPNDIARKGGESSITVSRLDYVTYIYRWMTLSIVFLHTLFVYTVLDLYFVQYNQ